MSKEKLKDILSTPTYCGQEQYIIAKITKYLIESNLDYVIDEHGNIFVTKGTADYYPCVVAHTDSVHRIVDMDIIELEDNNDVLYAVEKNTNKKNKSSPVKVCVLQPDYSTTGVDYKYYDPPRDLSPLLPEHQVDHVFLNKLTTFRQLKELSRNRYDIFVNLCEGYPEWEVPGIDVVYSLEALQLPFTGPTSQLYDVPKELMKYVAYCEGVVTPPYRLIEKESDLTELPPTLTFPLFVKPAHAGDSLGVNDDSLVHDGRALENKCKSLLSQYGSVLVENYIAGREFTVLVAANTTPNT